MRKLIRAWTILWNTYLHDRAMWKAVKVAGDHAGAWAAIFEHADRCKRCKQIGIVCGND